MKPYTRVFIATTIILGLYVVIGVAWQVLEMEESGE